MRRAAVAGIVAFLESDDFGQDLSIAAARFLGLEERSY